MHRSVLLLSLVPLATAQTPEIVKTTVVITAKPIEPTIDYRNAEVFQQTLFSRDDQIFHQLNAGINQWFYGNPPGLRVEVDGVWHFSVARWPTIEM